jgi:hypothetical protein
MEDNGSYADLFYAMSNQGYIEGGYDSIDEEVVRQHDCSECGAHMLLYKPFILVRDNKVISYRAFTFCASCGDYEEF